MINNNNSSDKNQIENGKINEGISNYYQKKINHKRQETKFNVSNSNHKNMFHSQFLNLTSKSNSSVGSMGSFFSNNTSINGGDLFSMSLTDYNKTIKKNKNSANTSISEGILSNSPFDKEKDKEKEIFDSRLRNANAVKSKTTLCYIRGNRK